MSQILFSLLNPVQLLEVAPVELPQYRSRHMDDYFHSLRLQGGQHMPNGEYYQPWQKSDVIKVQFLNSAGVITIKTLDCTGKVYGTVTATQKQINTFEPDFYIYEANILLNSLPEGFYWLEVSSGGRVFVSEGLDVKTEHLNSLLFEYAHPMYYEQMIFATGFTPSIRIAAILKKKETGSKDTLFEDQILDVVMVRSRTFRVWELIMGAPFGIPDWLEEKMVKILGCQGLKIDGKYYSKNPEAKSEPTDEVGYGALSSYRIELRASINRGAKVFDSVLDTDEELTMVLNTTSKGFGDTSDPNSVVTFNDVE